MKIGGFLPLSFIDYPSLPAAVFFTQGCNWRCPFCHNEGLLPARGSDEKDISGLFDHLDKRKKVLGGIVITGGEPTIHRDLPDFIRELKRFKLPVKLDTNGTNPSMVKELIDQRLVDYIAMDVKAPFEKYHQLTGRDVCLESLRKSIEIISSSNIAHHFRTTYPPHLLEEKDIETIRSSLPSSSKYVLQTYVEQK